VTELSFTVSFAHFKCCDKNKLDVAISRMPQEMLPKQALLAKVKEKSLWEDRNTLEDYFRDLR